MKSERARSVIAPADRVLCERFGGACGDAVSAQYISTLNGGVLFGVSGLSFPAPVCAALLADEDVCGVVSAFANEQKSVLISKKDGNYSVLSEKAGSVEDITNSEEGKKLLASSKSIIEYCSEWGGKLDEGGELICDLSSPAPGPHYYTNLLIGNRIGFDHPLQSTPKSAIDRIGGGCFRSHADTQVLATRWDYLPEQNGFPANRQFYLVENGQVIFYSGSAKQDSVEKATDI